MKMKRKLQSVLALALIVGLTAIPVRADALTFTGESGDLSASVDFVDSGGGVLEVTLTNTSLSDVMNPSGVLTAVFFTIDGLTGLSPDLAMLDGSVVLFGYPDGGGNVGGEWAYAEGLSGAPGGAYAGISSSGFDLFGDANFNGPNLQDPDAVNGLNYGITSAGDDPDTGNTAVTGGLNSRGRGEAVALIQNSVVFTLTGLPSDFDLSADDFSSLSFQYGTDLDEEPNVPVPEPSTLLLIGSGLIGLGLIGRRKFRV